MGQREPISKVDTAWLRMEQPTNLMMITGVIVFDQALDYPMLLQTVRQRFLSFRRFRQKAVDGPTGAHWEMDEDFDLHVHVRRTALPGKADRKELEMLVADLASTPLEKSRPLWQFHLVENYDQGPALICRIHHCIADGIALVQVFLSLTDEQAEASISLPDPEAWKKKKAMESPVFRRIIEPARGGLEFVSQLAQRAVEEGQKVLQDPALAGKAVTEVAEIANELAQSLALPSDAQTRLRGKLGVRKEAAWTSPLPLDEIKSVSKAFGCTVNDVLIAAVSGAVRRYLLDMGDDPDELPDIRATVPVNLRPLDHAPELGNQFGLVFLDLPISEEHPLKRLYTVHERMQELKSSKQAAVTFGVLAALGMGPSVLQKPILDLLSQKATTVLTNVPGPQHPLYLAGAKISEMMFWVPQNGTIGLGVSILSYDGKVFFGVIADRKLVPFPGDIIERFKPEFEKLLYLGMMLPLEGRPTPATASLLVNPPANPE